MEKKTKEAAYAYNEVIVQEILAFDPLTLLQDVLTPYDLEEYLQARDRVETSTDISNDRVTVLRNQRRAEQLFTDKYKENLKEVVEAFRRRATELIISERENVNSDNILTLYVWTQLQHITRSEVLYAAIGKQICNLLETLITDKWKLRLDNLPVQPYSKSNSILCPQDSATRHLFLSPENVRSGHCNYMASRKPYTKAHIDVRIDAPDGQTLLIPSSDLIDRHDLDGFDLAVYLAVASILDTSKRYNSPFSPDRRLYIATIHQQLFPGQPMRKKQKDLILASLHRLNMFRQRIFDPIYTKRKGHDVMTGYSVEYPHILECVFGEERANHGVRPYIRVLEIPVCLKYTYGIGQLERIPFNYIHDAKVQNTTLAIGIRAYLLFEIAQMKRTGNPPVLTYEKLYEVGRYEIGTALTGKSLERARARVTDTAKKQLDAWALNTDHPIIGTCVTLNKNNKEEYHGYEKVRINGKYALAIRDK